MMALSVEIFLLCFLLIILIVYYIAEKKDEVFDGWFAAMGVQALPASPAVGYTSWYNCYQNISEVQILRDLQGWPGRRESEHSLEDRYQTDRFGRRVDRYPI